MRAILFVLGGEVLSKGIWALAQLILIRFMAPEQFSTHSLAVAWHTMVFAGCLQSLNQVYVIGHDELNLEERESDFLALQFAFAIGGVLAGFLLADGFQTVLLPWSLLVVVSAVNECARTRLRRKLQFGRYSRVEVLKSLVFVVGLAIWALGMKREVTAAAVLWLHTAGMTASLLATGVRGLVETASQWPRHLPALARQILGSNIRYALGYFMLLSVSTRMDLLCLQELSTTEQVAVYAAGYRLYGLLMMALTSVHVVLIPLLQKATRRDELLHVLSRHRQLMIAVTPMFAILALSANWWFPLIDGGRYPQAVTVFQILTAAAAIGLAFSPYVGILLRLRDYRFLWWCAVSMVVAQPLLYAAAIWRADAIGAACATTGVFACLNLGIYRRVHQLFDLREAEGNDAFLEEGVAVRRAA
ncbi:MAG: lipopolysaccharide biosynthesis protein [Maioricimonas sp. JB045]|uniref:lipopolysaccharide biosynthesis protein n=1 Tax=Maioricimonas sp. JC845 TaxID=3232138 RepID=UPI00345747E4